MRVRGGGQLRFFSQVVLSNEALVLFSQQRAARAAKDVDSGVKAGGMADYGHPSMNQTRPSSARFTWNPQKPGGHQVTGSPSLCLLDKPSLRKCRSPRSPMVCFKQSKLQGAGADMHKTRRPSPPYESVYFFWGGRRGGDAAARADAAGKLASGFGAIFQWLILNR